VKNEIKGVKAKVSRIAVINGPNLNLLGTREPEVYGTVTLSQIIEGLERQASENDVTIVHVQSNSEGQLIDAIHTLASDADAMIINPGGLTHTSVSLRDALAVFRKPIIEVHLSNIYRREEFRHYSFISPVALGTISGLGPKGYNLALDALISILKRSPAE
jgi:3-dehydroquinate dehydratase II